MKVLEADKRKDPVARMVRDLTPEEIADWLVEYHGLKPEKRETVVINLREQFKWHRLQGRLDQNTTASLFAQCLCMRRSARSLEYPDRRLKEEGE